MADLAIDKKPDYPVLVVGCGYVGRRVAGRHLEKGDCVAALVRSAPSAETLRAHSIDTIEGDLDRPDTLRPLPTAGALIYYFAPPPPAGDDDPRINAFLAALDRRHPPARIVYLSTTGVYGDCRGEWISEERPPNPRTGRARRRLAAERALGRLSQETGVPAVVLRVPGIYGPGRLPVDRLRRRLPVIRQAESPYSNRIHADDLARACIAAAEYGKAAEVYNISDGHPTTMTDYFFRVADHLGLPRPPEISLEEAGERLSASMISYIEESRRLGNRKIREELGVELIYPDLEAGLAECDPKTELQ
jgi:nucleoside-diphosphate-sugar epimerase